MHDKTYQKGGWYKNYSDKKYASGVHRATFIAFILSFTIFTTVQYLFPSLFSLKPKLVLAGANQKVWSTRGDFNTGTDKSYVEITGSNDSDDAEIRKESNFRYADTSNGMINAWYSHTNGRRILKASTGTVVMVNNRGGQGSPSGIVIQHSHNNGGNWEGATQVTTADAYPSSIIDGSNNIYVVYSDAADGGSASYDVNFARLSYNVGTDDWSVAATSTVFDAGATTAGTKAAIERDATGRLWVAFRYFDGSNYSNRVMYSDDNGASWALSLDLDTATSSTAKITSLAAFGTKLAAIYGTNETGSFQVRWRWRNNADAVGTWQAVENINTWNSSAEMSSAVDTSGNIHVVYRRGGGESVYSYYNGTTWANQDIQTGWGEYNTYLSIKDDGSEAYIFYNRGIGYAGYLSAYRKRTAGSWGPVNYIKESFERDYDKVFVYDADAGTPFQDETVDAASTPVSGDVFHTTSGGMVKDTDDAVYVGLSEKNFQVMSHMNQAGVGGTVVWEYSKGGSDWQSFVPDRGAYNFTSNVSHEAIRCWATKNNIPGDWARSIVNGENYYWIRARVTTPFTTAPIASRLTGMLRIVYATSIATYTDARVYTAYTEVSSNPYQIRFFDLWNYNYPTTSYLSNLRFNAGTGIKAQWSTLSWDIIFPPDSDSSHGAKFKIRAANDNNGNGPQDELDAATWYGPGGATTGDDWSTAGSYFGQVYGSSPTSGNIPSAIGATQYADILIRLECDGITTPIVEDLTLNYNTLDAPTSFTTYRTDGTTVIGYDGWTNESQIISSFSASGLQSETTLTPQIEVVSESGSFSGNPTATGSSVAYNGSPVTLSVASQNGLSPGNYKYKVRYYDSAGRVSGWSSTEGHFNIEVTQPTGTFTINNDAQYANSQAVTLNISASDTGGSGLSQMQISNDGVFDTEPWEAYAATKAWTLSSGDGQKTVYVRFKDMAGNISSGNLIIQDSFNRANQSGWGTADQGGVWNEPSTTRWTIINNEATSGVDGNNEGNRIYNSDVTGSESLVKMKPNSTARFTGGVGARKSTSNYFRGYYAGVYIRDPSSTSSFEIVYVDDSNNLTLLNEKYKDIAVGVNYWMRFRAEGTSLKAKIWQDGSSEPANWDVETTHSTLSTGRFGMYQRAWAGAYYDNYQVVELTVSGGAVDTITLDTVNPTGTVTIAGGSQYTASADVSLTLSASDSGSGLHATEAMRFSNNGITWSSWEPYNTSKSWDLVTGAGGTDQDGPKTVYVQYKDNAGNIKEGDLVVSDSFDRANQNGWGTADTGGTWTVPDNTRWQIASNKGQGDVSGNNEGSYIYGSDVADAEVLATVRVNTGGCNSAGVSLRRSTTQNTHYSATLYINTPSTSSALELRYLNNGVENGIAGGDVTKDLTTNVDYKLRFRAVGTSLKAKVWPAAQVEPQNWDIETTHSALTTGRFGTYQEAWGIGWWDDYQVTDLTNPGSAYDPIFLDRYAPSLVLDPGFTLSASDDQSTVINVNWSTYADDSGLGSPVDHYSLERLKYADYVLGSHTLTSNWSLGGDGAGSGYYNIGDKDDLIHTHVNNVGAGPEDIEASVKYIFRIRVTDEAGNQGTWLLSDTGLTADTVKPTNPSNVVATACDGTAPNCSNIANKGYEIKLTWTASTDTGSGVTGYKVYRRAETNSTTPGDFTIVGYLDVEPPGAPASTIYYDNDTNNDATFTDTINEVPNTPIKSSATTRLNDWVDYYYRIVAIDATGNQTDVITLDSTPPYLPNNTNFATAKTKDVTNPSAPTNLVATAMGLDGSGVTQRIDISWTASTDTRTSGRTPTGAGSGIAGYRIERAQGDVNGPTEAFAQIATTTDTSYSNTGLSDSTYFWYRVRAVDQANSSNINDSVNNVSNYSSQSSALTYSNTIPTVPTEVTVTSKKGDPNTDSTVGDQITITFKGSYAQAYQIDKYEIYRSTTNWASANDWLNPSRATMVHEEDITDIQDDRNNTHTYVDNNLTDAATYYYKVRALDTTPDNPPFELGPYWSGLSGIAVGTLNSGWDTTPDATKPTTPQDVKVKDIHGDGLSLYRNIVTWERIPESDPANQRNSVVDFKEYRVYRYTDPISRSDLALIATKTTLGDNYHIDGINSSSANQLYYYYVVAVDNAAAEFKYANDSVINSYANISGNLDPVYINPAAAKPVVSNVSVSNIGVSSATVTWTTDQNADSVVEYRIYGTNDVVGTLKDRTQPTTNHSVNLISLQNNTRYQYRIVSRNPLGNIDETAANTWLEFTTQAFSILNISVSTTTTTATVTWTTSIASDSSVEYKRGDVNELSQTSGDPRLVTSHSVTLKSLRPDTSYTYKIRSVTSDKYVSDTQFLTFRTKPNDITQFVIVPDAANIAEQNITATSARIVWRTAIATTSWIDYGTSSGVYNQSAGNDNYNTVHVIELNNLTPGTTYYYRVRGKDTNDVEYTSPEYHFTAILKPQISNVKISNIEPYKATITFNTNVSTDTALRFGKNTAYGQQQGIPDYTRNHSIIIENLEDNTTYHYQIVVRDQFKNEAVTENATFNTPLDTEGPKISEVKIDLLPMGSDDETAQVIISWTTNKPSTTRVDYDEGVVGGVYSKSSIEDTSLNNSHTVIVKELNPAATYHFRMVSKDKRENESKTSDFTFVTPAKEKSILQLILKSLEETFSWVKNVGKFLKEKAMQTRSR